jgi:glucose/mannose-6-phosphate isomerase
MKNLDSLGVEKALTLFPEQIKECWNQAYSANIPQMNIRSVIVSGMGGSSNAAKILQGLYESELKIPFEIHNDYSLPAWVNSDTLVVANSYSGNTEETLSSIDSAKKTGAKILGVTTGGKIADMIKSGEISGVVVTPGETNPTGFPKTGLGVSFGALAGTLSKVEILPITGEEVIKATDELLEISKNWNVKEIAQWIHGTLPVLFGGRPFIGSLNAGRNAMCEISRSFTQFYDFPEVNHVLIEAMQKPESTKNIKYLFFESGFNEERVKLRYKVTKGILDEQSLTHKTYELKGSTKLAQGLEIPYFCAWLAFNLSMIDGSDPGPEPWILKLKESLSQPIH